jgi:zinc transporter 7
VRAHVAHLDLTAFGFVGWVSSSSVPWTRIGSTNYYRTFMGIMIHNLSASSHEENASTDLAAAVRQTAAGLLGTTVQLADLVCAPKYMLTR